MGMWDFEIAPGLTAGLALERTRFWLAALEAVGISLGSIGGGGLQPPDPATQITEAQVRKHYELLELKRDIEAARQAQNVSAKPEKVGASTKRVQKTAKNKHVTTESLRLATRELPAQQMLVPSVESNLSVADDSALEVQRRQNELALLIILSEV